MLNVVRGCKIDDCVEAGFKVIHRILVGGAFENEWVKMTKIRKTQTFFSQLSYFNALIVYDFEDHIRPFFLP